MKLYRKFMAFMVVLLLSTPVCYADGNKLLEQCTAAERFIDTQELRDQASIGLCFGLIQGVRDTMQFMENGGSIKACFPKGGINNGQAARIVTSYLKKNPASLHENEVFLTILAFVDAYPCK